MTVITLIIEQMSGIVIQISDLNILVPYLHRLSIIPNYWKLSIVQSDDLSYLNWRYWRKSRS